MPIRSTREQLAALETRICRVEEQFSSLAQAVENLNDTVSRLLPVSAPGAPVPTLPAAPPQVVNHYYLGGDAPVLGPPAPALAVTFTDAALIAAAMKPPFVDDQGDYEDPDLVIAGGRVPGGVPATIPCPGEYVIYSSWAEVVANCRGFGGPNAGNNAVVARAKRNAEQVAARIGCEGGCPKTVGEIWRGWSCGGNPQPVVAIGAVELKVVCRVAL